MTLPAVVAVVPRCPDDVVARLVAVVPRCPDDVIARLVAIVPGRGAAEVQPVQAAGSCRQAVDQAVDLVLAGRVELALKAVGGVVDVFPEVVSAAAQ